MLRKTILAALIALCLPCMAQTTCNVVQTSNPVAPTTRTVCPQLPNLIPIASSGAVEYTLAGTALIFQYCAGAVCSPAFAMTHLPINITAVNPMLGGSPGAGAILYIQRSVRPAVIFYDDAKGKLQPAIVVPAIGK